MPLHVALRGVPDRVEPVSRLSRRTARHWTMMVGNPGPNASPPALDGRRPLDAHTELGDWSVSRMTQGEQVLVRVHRENLVEVGIRVDLSCRTSWVCGSA